MKLIKQDLSASHCDYKYLSQNQVHVVRLLHGVTHRDCRIFIFLIKKGLPNKESSLFRCPWNNWSKPSSFVLHKTINRERFVRQICQFFWPWLKANLDLTSSLFIQRLCGELDGLLGHPFRLVHGYLVLRVQVVDHVTWSPSHMVRLNWLPFNVFWIQSRTVSVWLAARVGSFIMLLI